MSTTLETPHGPVTLRPLTTADLDAMRELRLAMLKAHPEAFGDDYAEALERPQSHWEERIAKMASGTDQAMFVAEAAGRLVASVGIFRLKGRKIAHNAEIYSVYVDKAWRGLRLSDHLVAMALDWARAAGLRNVWLYVVATNTSALASYIRAGFRVVGLEPAMLCHDGVYHDEVHMLKELHQTDS